MLGTYDGQFDLKKILLKFLKFERCSEYCGWAAGDHHFQLANALTGSASDVVKEFGSQGKIEDIIELLKTRYENDLHIDKFKQELQTRKKEKVKH